MINTACLCSIMLLLCLYNANRLGDHTYNALLKVALAQLQGVVEDCVEEGGAGSVLVDGQMLTRSLQHVQTAEQVHLVTQAHQTPQLQLHAAKDPTHPGV